MTWQGPWQPPLWAESVEELGGMITMQIAAEISKQVFSSCRAWRLKMAEPKAQTSTTAIRCGHARFAESAVLDQSRAEAPPA